MLSLQKFIPLVRFSKRKTVDEEEIYLNLSKFRKLRHGSSIIVLVLF